MEDSSVSVIVATYRRRKELQDALLSLTRQTYPHTEIIVVDDNADRDWNNAVSAIVDSVTSQSGKKITVIRNESNMGSARSRNRGIFSAAGEYITFLDDDDVYLPEKIELQLKDMIRENADYGLTDLLLYNAEGTLVDKRIRSYIADRSPAGLFRYHLLYHMTGTDTLMFRAAYLKEIGAFPEVDIGDEFYLMKEAILGGGKLAYSPHCYVKAIVHRGDENGLSSGQQKIDGENVLFQSKRSHFDRLEPQDIRYIKMRHYAVIAFAYWRMKRYLRFVQYGLLSFFHAPLRCIQLVGDHTMG